MASKALEAEIARKNAEKEENPSPANQHDLSLLEARLEGLLVHVNTPERGTPFTLDQVGSEGGKEVREKMDFVLVDTVDQVLEAALGNGFDRSVCE